MKISWLGWVAALWGVSGFTALMASALLRLTPIAMEPIVEGTLTAGQIVLYVGFVGLNAYAEGYRGFQGAFSPRLAVRTLHLAHHPTALRTVLAPMFCMTLIGATRRRLIVSWVLTAAIVAVVVLVRHMPQPWRGIIDGGVVVGLAWGLLATFWFLFRSARGNPPDVDPALPETVQG